MVDLWQAIRALILSIFGNLGKNMTENPSLSKLRWACRRGMLELDVLLGNFLEEAYANLPVDKQQIFVELLDNNDQDLFGWLTGRNTAPTLKIAEIVDKIREHAYNRH